MHAGRAVTSLCVDDRGAWSAEDCWLPRSSRLILKGLRPASTYDVSLNLYSGPDDLYRYFPFNAWVHAPGQLGAILEVGGPERMCTLELRGVVPSANGLELDLDSELGDVPAHVGLGPDKRELALLLTSVEVRASNADPQYPHPRYANGAGTTRPVFVIGAYRSGTSITTWAIGQHPNIFALDETGWVHSGLITLKSCFALANDRANSAAKIYDIDERRFLVAYAKFLDQFHHDISRDRANAVAFTRLAGKAKSYRNEIQIQRSPKAPKTRWIDGTPENATAGRLLADAYPDGQFIIMVRHPLEVVRSLKFFDRAGGRSLDTREALEVWSRLTALAIDTARYVGPDRALVVTYDQLRSPEALMRRCLGFLGEPYFEPAAAAYGVRLNSSHVHAEPLEDIDTQQARCAMRAYEQICSGALPRLSDFGVNGLDCHDDYMNAVCGSVRRALSAAN